MPVSARGSRHRISVSSGNGLNFITNVAFPLLKYDINYNWKDFHTIRKSANVVVWKDRENEYISSA